VIAAGIFAQVFQPEDLNYSGLKEIVGQGHAETAQPAVPGAVCEAPDAATTWREEPPAAFQSVASSPTSRTSPAEEQATQGRTVQQLASCVRLQANYA
jgi:hypothetical protein